MRVCVLTGDSKGGIRRHIHDVFFGLADQFEFSYIFGESSREETVFLSDLTRIETLLDHRIASFTIDKAPSLSDLANIFHIVRRVRDWRCELIHGHGAKGGLYARVAGALTGTPVIYTPHGGALHDVYGYFGSMAYISAEKLLARLTNVMLFESEYSRNQFERKIGHVPGLKIVVNPNAIPFGGMARTKEGQSNGRIRFGVFGMLREIKGQHVALEAFKRACILEPDKMELHFFGDGEDRLYLMKMAEGIKDFVFFHGTVFDVQQHMADMDATIVPSLAESFSYVALEAVFSLRFVIGSRVGALPELISTSNTGFLIPPGDEIKLANAMVDFCRFPVFPSEVDERTRQKYCFKQFLQRIRETYLACVPTIS